MIVWLVVGVVLGILIGAGYAESEIVRARVRQAWRRGYQDGKYKVTMEWYRSQVPETPVEAADRLIRESGGR